MNFSCQFKPDFESDVQFVLEFQKRVRELEEQIAELKANWPAHSVQPWMLAQLEALEEELEILKQEKQDE